MTTNPRRHWHIVLADGTETTCIADGCRIEPSGAALFCDRLDGTSMLDNARLVLALAPNHWASIVPAGEVD